MELTKLNTLYNYSKISKYYNNDQHKQLENAISTMFLSLLLTFVLIQQATLLNYILFLNILEIFKISF